MCVGLHVNVSAIIHVNVSIIIHVTVSAIIQSAIVHVKTVNVSPLCNNS